MKQLFAPLRRRFTTARWRTRLTLWIAATVAGLCVVMFARLADLALALFAQVTAGRGWLTLLLTPALGMLVVFLTRRYFPGSEGSGIPQVIAATRLSAAGKPVGGLISLRIALAKVGLGTLALSGGFSAGREGPSVQVAASLMHAAHRFLPNNRVVRVQDMILAGGAAGIAAAFNTPLAGIAFAVEELGRKLETRTSGILLSTIILCGMISIGVQGDYNYFGRLNAVADSRAIIFPVLTLGLLCGLLGGLFSLLLLLPQRYGHHALWRWRAAHPVWFAGICGLVVASLGWATGGLSFGSGYGVTNDIINHGQSIPWYSAPARFIATLATYFSGIPGGIFAPSLAVGAALGGNVAQLFDLGAQPIIALCMAGFLAAVTQSPITSAIIVMEMIDSHGMVISLMAVALIAKAVSSRLGPELYQQLALGYWRRAQQSVPDSTGAVTSKRAK